MTSVEHAFWLGAGTLGPAEPAPGVRRLELDRSGRPTLGPFVPVGENPTFLADLPDGRMIVAHELPEGRISLVEPETGRVLSSAATHGADPCHLAVLPASGPQSAAVFVANYTGGILTVHRIDGDQVGEPTLEVRYRGGGPDLDRQASPHPHQAVIDESGELLFVPDLGTDAIHVHRIADLLAGDAAHTDLTLPAGTGPRHLVQRGGVLVVAGELDLSVSVIDLASGEVIDSMPVTSAAVPGEAGPSAIRLTNSGYVIVANRNPNTLVVFGLGEDGHLSAVGEFHSGGVHPRDMELTGDGRYLVVANQWSDHLTIFELDPVLGGLRRVAGIDTPSPECLLRIAD